MNINNILSWMRVNKYDECSLLDNLVRNIKDREANVINNLSDKDQLAYLKTQGLTEKDIKHFVLDAVKRSVEEKLVTKKRGKRYG